MAHLYPPGERGPFAQVFVDDCAILEIKSSFIEKFTWKLQTKPVGSISILECLMDSYLEGEELTTSDDSSNEDINTYGDNLQEDEEYLSGIWRDNEIFERHHYIQNQDSEEADTFESLSEFENIVNLEFSSEEEAGVFFNSYAKLKGFGMRKGKVRRMKRKGRTCSQSL